MFWKQIVPELKQICSESVAVSPDKSGHKCKENIMETKFPWDISELSALKKSRY